MPFSMEIGSTRLSNEVHNLMVEGSNSTGPTGPAGLPGPTGPVNPGVQPNNYSVTFAPGVSATGMLYKVDNTVYWSFSVYIPPGNYLDTIFIPIQPGDLGPLFDVLPNYFQQYRQIYLDSSTNKPYTGDFTLTKFSVLLNIYVPLPSGGETSFNFSYQI